MLIDHNGQITEPHFAEISRATAYHVAGETLIQGYTPIGQAERGEPSQFFRVGRDADTEELGRAVLSALDLAKLTKSDTERNGWMIMRRGKTDIMRLWKKLVSRATICVIERSILSLAIIPTKKRPMDKDAFSYGPLDGKAIHLPLDTSASKIGESLLEAFRTYV